MTRVKRSGAKETFSVSVSPATKRLLKRAAERRFGGNVSALVEAIAVEADRRDALDWLVENSPPVSDSELAAFIAEARGPARKPKTPAREGRPRRRAA